MCLFNIKISTYVKVSMFVYGHVCVWTNVCMHLCFNMWNYMYTVPENSHIYLSFLSVCAWGGVCVCMHMHVHKSLD